MNNTLQKDTIDWFFSIHNDKPIIKHSQQSVFVKFDCGCEHALHHNSECLLLCDKHYSDLAQYNMLLFEQECGKGVVHGKN